VRDIPTGRFGSHLTHYSTSLHQASGFKAPPPHEPRLNRAWILENLLLEFLNLRVNHRAFDRSTEKFVACFRTLALYEGKDLFEEP